MKLLPELPGHFTRWEFLALGVWIALGAVVQRRERGGLRLES